MKKIEIEVTWEVSKTVTVYADNLEEGMEMIEDSMDDIANGFDYNSEYIYGTAEFITEDAIIEDVNDEDCDKEVIL